MSRASSFENMAGYIPQERTKDREKENVDAGRRAENFQEAIRATVLGVLEKRNDQGVKNAAWENLSKYEKSLLEKEGIPKINMLIDVDGVLVDTEGEIENLIKNLIKAFASDSDVLENIREGVRSASQARMPYRSGRELLECRKIAQQMTLVTDRFGIGPCYFPCFSKKEKKRFEGVGRAIAVETGSFKFLPMLSHEEKFIPQIAAGDVTYYFGSSQTDRKYVGRIWELMDQEKIPREKLVYVHIEGRDRKNIL